MNLKLMLHILGGLLMSLAVTMVLPLLVSIYYDDGLLPIFLKSSIATLLLGAILYWGCRNQSELTHREGFGVVAFGWFFIAVMGALPFYLSGVVPSIVDAYFESMSGFTTTGSTIINSLGEVPRSLLFWRAMIQWLGGMGIIVLSVAILPFLGIGGVQLFQAEVPGPTKERLTPKIQETAKSLWGVYFLLTLLQMLLLMLGGVNLFDAVTHSFTTLATGGFSNYDQSVAFFQSRYIHWIFTLFMFLAGINFTLHYHLLVKGRIRYFGNEEFRFYLLIFVVAITSMVAINHSAGSDIWITIRDTTFQVVSLGTSTGYATVDYQLWAPVVQFGLIMLMVIGGCAGSTGGGAKVVRLLITLKHSLNQLFLLVHPKGVRPLTIGHSIVAPAVVQRVVGYFSIYTAIFFIASMVLIGGGMDMLSAFSAAIACLSNIGPGFGVVGPTETFAMLPDLSKLALTFCMLAGRLEIFTIFVLFLPSFWKR
jgi:trk system potassium uptake protein